MPNPNLLIFSGCIFREWKIFHSEHRYYLLAANGEKYLHSEWCEHTFSVNNAANTWTTKCRYLRWVAAGKRWVRTRNHWSLILLLNYLYWKYNYSLKSFFSVLYFSPSPSLSLPLSVFLAHSSSFLNAYFAISGIVVDVIEFTLDEFLSRLPLILFLFPRVFNKYHFHRMEHSHRVAQNTHESWHFSPTAEQNIKIIQTTM